MKQEVQKKEKDKTYPAGIKWTKQRKSVYDILIHADGPLSVQEIYNKIIYKESGYAISTIYRILSAFEEHGMVTRSTWLHEDITLFEWNKGGHTHYATCLNCHKRIVLPHCPLDHQVMVSDNTDFMITDHKLELYGYCKECRKQVPTT